jgi:hypothetical protein
MEGPMSKKTKEPPKRANHKGNIKFPNLFLLRETYQIRKGGGPPERRPSLEEPSPTITTRFKLETAYARYNVTIGWEL